MFRALEKYFGCPVDLDIEAQRALLHVKQQMAIDWKHVAQLVTRANFTFGGAHVRIRGRVLPGDRGELLFEVAGTHERILARNGATQARNRDGEFALRVEDWTTTPSCVVLAENG